MYMYWYIPPLGSQAPTGNTTTTACSVPANFTCEDGQCVPGAVRCNGRPDCFDQSDEKGCSKVKSKCSPTFFPCANGVHCIIGRFRCNGFPDCPDGSDEHDCIENADLCASASRFHCNNGHCVHRSFLCNGEDNCRDNSDEENCEITTVASPHRDLSPLDYSGMTLGVVTCCALFVGLLSALFGLVLHHQRKRGILTSHGPQAAHHRRRHQPLLLSHFVILDSGYPRGSPPSTAPSTPSPFPCSPQAQPMPAGSPPSYSEAALDPSYPSWFDLPPPPYLPSAEGQPQPHTAPDLPSYEACLEPPGPPPHHGGPARSTPSHSTASC
ncbi:hypothetical protein ACEWY4_015842 [Coilia grayii]|uniref:Low-density lipoprotein receptor class A domain-containing protein 3 n=1 Tax=Coilia grayii TaxID=363190 RepID=A0ABD1JP64_9TELE